MSGHTSWDAVRWERAFKKIHEQIQEKEQVGDFRQEDTFVPERNAGEVFDLTYQPSVTSEQDDDPEDSDIL